MLDLMVVSGWSLIFISLNEAWKIKTDKVLIGPEFKHKESIWNSLAEQRPCTVALLANLPSKKFKLQLYPYENKLEQILSPVYNLIEGPYQFVQSKSRTTENIFGLP